MALTPATTVVTWRNGTAMVERAGADVRVAAGFEGQDGDALAVRVEVENQGAPTFEVDPRWVAFTPCRSADIASCLPAGWARDPEHVLASLEAKRAQESVDAGNAQAALAVLAIFSAVVDIASIAKGRANHTTGLGTLAALGAHDQVAHRHQATAQALDARRQDFAAAALRRTTLARGQSAAGRILLPIELRARHLWLHVRAGDQKFSIPFHQTVTPDPHQTRKGSSFDSLRESP